MPERTTINVNKNNPDSVLSAFSSSVNFTVENTLAGDSLEENVRLSVKDMKDVEPAVPATERTAFHTLPVTPSQIKAV